jgi:hypothetical protein
MEPWIARIEQYIKPDIELGVLAASKLTHADRAIICGDKPVYSLEDAKNLYKKQWKMEEYREAMDLAEGYSPERMLEILRQRVRYVMDRGATLNNPHIPKSFLIRFNDQLITREHAGRIREKFSAYFGSRRP